MELGRGPWSRCQNAARAGSASGDVDDVSAVPDQHGVAEDLRAEGAGDDPVEGEDLVACGWAEALRVGLECLEEAKTYQMAIDELLRSRSVGRETVDDALQSVDAGRVARQQAQLHARELR